MDQSTISITEAAYLLGFSEVSNFTRAFKRWTGKSPRDYRQSLGTN
jgi:AraC-like DNA-binding protein